MKKLKLTRKSLDELVLVMPVIDELEQGVMVGGGDGDIVIYGGVLHNGNGGVTFIGNDGTTCFFEGVTARTPAIIADGTAYQFGGNINMSKKGLSTNFGIEDFAHEYGHYLQQKEMGVIDYTFQVAIPSAWNLLHDPQTHDQQPYEQGATTKGMEYYNTHKQNN